MNCQLNEVISQIQNWTFLFMILNGKREVLKQYSGKIFRRQQANLDFRRIEEKFHEIETIY